MEEGNQRGPFKESILPFKMQTHDPEGLYPVYLSRQCHHVQYEYGFLGALINRWRKCCSCEHSGSRPWSFYFPKHTHCSTTHFSAFYTAEISLLYWVVGPISHSFRTGVIELGNFKSYGLQLQNICNMQGFQGKYFGFSWNKTETCYTNTVLTHPLSF